eukprot:1263486-Prymnesium_polylepis.1
MAHGVLGTTLTKLDSPSHAAQIRNRQRARPQASAQPSIAPDCASPPPLHTLHPRHTITEGTIYRSSRSVQFAVEAGCTGCIDDTSTKLGGVRDTAHARAGILTAHYVSGLASKLAMLSGCATRPFRHNGYVRLMMTLSSSLLEEAPDSDSVTASVAVGLRKPVGHVGHKAYSLLSFARAGAEG